MEKGKEEEEGEAFVIPENRSLVASVERGGDGTERKEGDGGCVQACFLLPPLSHKERTEDRDTWNQGRDSTNIKFKIA